MDSQDLEQRSIIIEKDKQRSESAQKPKASIIFLMEYLNKKTLGFSWFQEGKPNPVTLDYLQTRNVERMVCLPHTINH
jgi:hypothetical protein